MYKFFIRPFLFFFDEESMQRRVARLGQWLERPLFLGFIKANCAKNYPSLHTHVAGLDFMSPLGVAAGFDKPAQLLSLLSALGFGAVEVGTVTPEPQPGNPKPRLFRLAKDRALINRMGFNSEGVQSLIKKLQNKPSGLIVGVNIGKNKDTPNNCATQDYQKMFAAVADSAHYVMVNVSSPNTPGLRELQDKNLLRGILDDLQKLNRQRVRSVPIFLKIAPDLNESQLNDIIDIVGETSITGIMAINTTITRDGLKTDPKLLARIGDGGLSGPLMKERANKMISYLYQKLGSSVIIIGAGGIVNAQDAYDKIRAGASLVQMYTGIVYEGPGVAKKINSGLAAMLKRDGFKNIADAVGTMPR